MNSITKRIKEYLCLGLDNRTLLLLLRYLKERKALKQYVTNRRYALASNALKDSFARTKITDTYEVINFSFLWSETPQGSNFWCELHEEWNEYIDNL